MQQLQDTRMELQLATLDAQVEALAKAEGVTAVLQAEVTGAAAEAEAGDVSEQLGATAAQTAADDARTQPQAEQQGGEAGGRRETIIAAGVAAHLKQHLEDVRAELGAEVASVLIQLQETLDQVGQQCSSNTWAETVRQQLHEAMSARYETGGVLGNASTGAIAQGEDHTVLDTLSTNAVCDINSGNEGKIGCGVPGGINLPRELQQLLQLMLTHLGTGGSNSKQGGSWGSAAAQGCTTNEPEEGFTTAYGGPAMLLGAARPWITTPSGTVTPMYSRRGTEVSMMGGRKHQSVRSSLANGLFASRAGSQAGGYVSCNGTSGLPQGDSNGSGYVRSSSGAGGGPRGCSLLGPRDSGGTGSGCSSSPGSSRLSGMQQRPHDRGLQQQQQEEAPWHHEEQHRLQQEQYFERRQQLHEQEEQQPSTQPQPASVDAAAVELLQDMFIAAQDKLQALAAAHASHHSSDGTMMPSTVESAGPAPTAAQEHMEAAHKLMHAAQEHLKAATTAAAGGGCSTTTPGQSSSGTKAGNSNAHEEGSKSSVARNRQMWMALLSSARSLATPPPAPCLNQNHNRGLHSPVAPSYLGLLYQPYTRVHRMCRITAPAANMHSAMASSSPRAGHPDGSPLSPQHHSPQQQHQHQQHRLLV